MPDTDDMSTAYIVKPVPLKNMEFVAGRVRRVWPDVPNSMTLWLLRTFVRRMGWRDVVVCVA